ncbi:MAG: hypothetical protein M1503_02855 [Thaumarchaeota archaeon]|nr:hypothetical protein [Nitrososphaerota archaeon]MCL5317191.1 hypothetical protein [Nitrososphaerota archaeon]
MGKSEVFDDAQNMAWEGMQTFRYDTFGDEEFWGGALKLHQAIAGEANGGVGPGVSPQTALAVGLKVDVDALPESLKSDLKAGKVNLTDPATTIALLKLNAVVGVTGFFNKTEDMNMTRENFPSRMNRTTGMTLTSIGIQCALCHSTVDDSFAPGIGHRMDGWANRDLNVGDIIALAPNLKPIADLLGVNETTVRQVLHSWGPGKFDAELILDGKAFRPDNKSAATLIPPAFGLAGVNLHTWTGWGSVTHWNALVAILEMHGKGRFWDPRLNNSVQFPIAAKAGFWNVSVSNPDDDRFTPKLAVLQFYQLALVAPKPPKGSFNESAAKRGDDLFTGKAGCSRCHVEPKWTEPGWNAHKPSEIGIDSFQADRAPDKIYRTSPLGGLWTHQKGGFYHDGRFATLLDVVDHYDKFFGLNLTSTEKNDLVEYLKSLPD